MTRHAWLQKHPSPLATGGEFHWYPDAGDRERRAGDRELRAGDRELRAGDRELRAGFVERLRGVESPAVLWRFERGRVAWGQAFSATAPLDGRRYVGLVLSVIEDDAPVAELLTRLSPPRPEPWHAGSAPREPEAAALIDAAPARAARGDAGMVRGDAAPAGLERGDGALAGAAPGDAVGVIRALISGGVAVVEDPSDGALARWIGSLERVLPEAGEQMRCGVWRLGTARPGRDRVAELAVAAWREPGSRAAAGWTLLCELARTRGESIDCIGATLEALDASAALTDGERAELSGGRAVVDVLHAWGRGRFDRSATAGTLATRLADLVAFRALARLAAGQDAGGAIAEARWHALLPARRRAALLAAITHRASSLRGAIEAAHA